jgi:hypothetical protein
MANTDQPAPGPDSPEASPAVADSEEAGEALGSVRQWSEDGTVIVAAILALWSLVFALLAVHAAHQHKWAEFGGYTYAAVIGVAIGLLGMKFPSLYEKREPETLAEAAKLMPRWTQKPGWRRIAFWAWLTWALFLTAGTVASGVRQVWVAFATTLWAATWCWVRFAYALKGRPPPSDLPASFP